MNMLLEMRDTFNAGRTRTRMWRTSQLKAVKRMMEIEESRLCGALNKDLRKDDFDSIVDEISFVANEAEWFLDHLGSLMRNRKISLSVANIGGTGYIKPEPLGIVLNIGAWNYPVQLVFSPLLSIIAAGNCCVIKPSELSPHTSKLIAELVPKYMDNDCIKIVEGGIPETTALLRERWDHIIYTGNGTVARIIYKAASQHLTPCTLELGGKCPTYVDDRVNIVATVNRIVWTKFKNAGQTCLAVDYILVHQSIKDEFLQALQKAIVKMYTSNPQTSPDYCRIINERHYRRVCDLLDSSADKVIIFGGDRNADDLYVGPTVVTNVSVNDKMMQEEIFGPILPVLSVKDHKEAIDIINSRPKPLHLNVFSGRQSIIDEFIERTSSGGFSGNDGLIFKAEKPLPFGGVGDSGFGCYSGEDGFLNFSHKKSVLIKPLNMEFLFELMRYAPHTPTKLKRSTFVLNLDKRIRCCLMIFLPIVVLALGAAVFFGLAKGGYIPNVAL